MVSAGRGAQGLPPVVRSLDLGVEGSGTVAWSVRVLERGWGCGPWAGWPAGGSGNWAALGGVPRCESVRTQEASSTDNAGSGRHCVLPSLGGPSPVSNTAENSSLKSPGLWPLLLLKPAAPAEVCSLGPWSSLEPQRRAGRGMRSRAVFQHVLEHRAWVRHWPLTGPERSFQEGAQVGNEKGPRPFEPVVSGVRAQPKTKTRAQPEARIQAQPEARNLAQSEIRILSSV